ncbi:MAG: spore coat associated protein CotJA [Clostridia bacterium]|nr:spore coat associated protein CotJA [Clostridia bacterium]
MLQRNGRLTNLSSYGSIPYYRRTETGRADGEKCNCRSEVPNNCECNTKSCKSCGDVCTGLAIASVKMQKWCDIYELEKGYCKGTIFAQLDLPFCGMRGVRL